MRRFLNTIGITVFLVFVLAGNKSLAERAPGNLEHIVTSADLVVIGTAETIGIIKNANWRENQEITFKVEKFVKGDFPELKLKIIIRVSEDAPTFYDKTGRRYLVCLRRINNTNHWAVEDDGRWPIVNGMVEHGGFHFKMTAHDKDGVKYLLVEDAEVQIQEILKKKQQKYEKESKL